MKTFRGLPSIARCAVALAALAASPARALDTTGTASPVTGNATWFTALGSPYGGCGLPQDALDSQAFVALNVYNTPGDYAFYTRPLTGANLAKMGLWNNGHNCGRWVRVTIGDNCTGVNDGAKNQTFCRNGSWVSDGYNGATQDMIVADSCGDDNGWCRDDPFHLDLAQGSLNLFQKGGAPVGDLYPAHWNNRHITWEFIPAPSYTGDITIGFLQGGMTWWGAIAVNHLPNGIHGVEYFQNGAWTAAEMNGDMGQSFIVKPLQQGGNDFQIRVRDADDALLFDGRVYSFSLPASCGSQCSVAFTPVTYTTSSGTGTGVPLTVTMAGTGSGTVTSTPAGVSCGSACSSTFAGGTVVTLSAAASSGSVFGGWSGACTGTSPSCTVTLSAAQSVGATFEPIVVERYTVSVVKAGGGSGTVSGGAGAILCGTSCSAAFAAGTVVTLTATAASGTTFGGWSGDCSGTGATCVLTVSGNKTATASFPTCCAAATLTVSKSGTGSGTVSGSGISCGSTCSAAYAAGATVTLTAKASDSSTFGGWSGACTGTSAACVVTMTQARSVNATFNTSCCVVSSLAVTLAGSGGGTVTSNPSGISCTSSTCTASFTPTSTVTLSASAASGSVFTGWSGACTGTAPTCLATLGVGGTVAVTATFVKSTTTPCANPVTFTGSSSNFDTTGAVCYRTSQTVNGWGCSNFAGRTVAVNGGTATATCGAGPFPLPKYTDGYTYFTITAGTYPWTNMYVW